MTWKNRTLTCFSNPNSKGSSKVTVPVPFVDEKKCNRCGLCGEVCAFNAILPLGEDVLTFHELCHGCGGCTLFCPTNAIREEPQEIGVIEWGNSGEIFHVGKAEYRESPCTAHCESGKSP